MKILITIITILLATLPVTPASAFCDASKPSDVFWACMAAERQAKELLQIEREQLQQLEEINENLEDNLIQPLLDDD